MSYKDIDNVEYTFAVVTEWRKHDHETKVSIGGLSKKCCIINVTHSRRTGEAKYASLSDVFYHEKCQFAADLQRSAGTKALLHASLACILILFPEVEYITIDDNSLVNCERIPGRVDQEWGGRPIGFSKADHNILKYGRTWYQRIFPTLRPQSELGKASLDHFLKKLKTQITDKEKRRSKIMDMWQYVHTSADLMPRCKDWARRPQVIKSVIQQYTQSQTYKDFFKWLCSYVADQEASAPRAIKCSSFEREYFLVTLQKWMKFMGLTSLSGLAWELDLRNIPRPSERNGIALNRTEEHDGHDFKITHRVFPTRSTNSDLVF